MEDCGCRIEMAHQQEDCLDLGYQSIAFCPLHAGAKRMREALKTVCRDKMPECDPEGWENCTCDLHEPIKSILSQANGGKEDGN